jgi:hypothetical protein
MVYVIGIDFGTSNSCVTVATFERDASGRLEAHPINPPTPISVDGRETIPTVICLDAEEGVPALFGEPAEEKAAHYPERVRAGFKMGLGAPGAKGREAFEWAKEFLTHLRAQVAEYAPLDGTDKEDRIETVIGHPVQWTPDQREETRRAAEAAGFPNVQLEDESQAALYAHLCEEGRPFRPEAGSRILMIDMGGGTTDFAFMQFPTVTGERPVSRPVDPASLVEPWRAGHGSYGGRDLDELLLEHLTRESDTEWVARNRAALMRAVRHFKEAFSNAVRAGLDGHETMWLVENQTLQVSLTREEFEVVAADYIRHLEALIRAALSLANLAPAEVATVLLTGGHSRWYFVDETLRRVFSHISVEKGSLLRHAQPEQSVAWGLGYVPLVRTPGGTFLTPLRKSAHSIWLHVPYGTRVEKSSARVLGRSAQTIGAGWDEPVLILPRGHQLPHLTPKPLRIEVNKLALDPREATVRLQFFSSAGGTLRVPLHEREARFPRTTLESLWQRLGARLPWRKGVEEDRFELYIACHIDENELLTGEVVIARYYKGKEVAVQRQKLQTQRDSQPGAAPSIFEPSPVAA